jgi:hypothetical protein
MRKNAIRLLAIAICLVAGAAWAQQRKSAPIKHSDDDPNLEATMKFIQDKLNVLGPVTYVSHGHDSNNGHDWTNHFSNEASRVVANLSLCRFYYHWKAVVDGHVSMDADIGIRLRDVQKIDVLSREKYFNEDNLASGHPSWTAKVEPSVFVVRVQRPAHVENQFMLPDEESARQLAKALTRAVELCGVNKETSNTD